MQKGAGFAAIDRSIPIPGKCFPITTYIGKHRVGLEEAFVGQGKKKKGDSIALGSLAGWGWTIFLRNQYYKGLTRIKYES